MDFFCRAFFLADLLSEVLFNEDKQNYHHEIFMSDVNDPVGKDAFAAHSDSSSSSLGQKLHRLFEPKNSNSNVHLISIGGGPGYDFVAAALLVSYRNILQSQRKLLTLSPEATTTVRSTVFDYEEGWWDLVDCMALATRWPLLIVCPGGLYLRLTYDYDCH